MSATSKVASGGATRRRLLEAAEELFSERGFERVSVRDVTEKAGANVAAINYHFGSREGLVEKVIERYITPVNEERMARLEALERKAGAKPVAVEELLEAFFRPFVTQVRRSELSEKLSLKLMGRMVADQAGRMPAAVEGTFQTMVRRYSRAFAKALPGVDGEDLLWRLHFVVGAMIHAMSHEEMLQRLTDGAAGAPSTETTLARLVRFSAAGLKQRDDTAQGGEEAAGPQGEFLF